MTPEEAVRTRLLAIGAVTALVGTRVYQLLLPQGVAYPAIRVQLIDEPLMDNVDGQGGYVVARVQVDVYAAVASGVDPYASAVAVAEAVQGDGIVPSPTGLHNWRALLGGFDVKSVQRIDRNMSFEVTGEQRLVRARQDYRVWAAAA